MFEEKVILFYDGTCGFCHKVVQLSFKWLKDKNVYFTPLQGSIADEVKAKYSDFPRDLDSIVLLKNDKLYIASSAFFELAKHFRFPWSTWVVFKVFPLFISNFFYRIVANNRYRIFGRKDVCEIPTPEFRKQFLD